MIYCPVCHTIPGAGKEPSEEDTWLWCACGSLDFLDTRTWSFGSEEFGYLRVKVRPDGSVRRSIVHHGFPVQKWVSPAEGEQFVRFFMASMVLAA